MQDSARWVAQVVKTALEAGAALHVGVQNAAVTATDGDLSLFRYTDSGSYLARAYPAQAKPAGTPGVRVLDSRISRTISGRTMVSVIADMQLDPASNVINNGLSVQQLGADLGSAVFPVGSRINRRTTVTLAPSIVISSLTTDGRPQAEAQTLAQLIAAKPASAVNLPSTGGSQGLGPGSSTSASPIPLRARCSTTSATSTRSSSRPTASSPRPAPIQSPPLTARG